MGRKYFGEMGKTYLRHRTLGDRRERDLSNHNPQGKGFDPSLPHQLLYTYSMADWDEIELALKVSKSKEYSWRQASIEERSHLLTQAAQKLRESQEDLIGMMIGDGGKTPYKSDPEISEAIDFAEY